MYFSCHLWDHGYLNFETGQLVLPVTTNFVLDTAFSLQLFLTKTRSHVPVYIMAAAPRLAPFLKIGGFDFIDKCTVVGTTSIVCTSYVSGK
jgi:hypothetical protein